MCIYMRERERERVLSLRRERSRKSDAPSIMRVTNDILHHHHRKRGEEGL